MNKKNYIDREYLESTLIDLLNIPSPTGFTDKIVYAVSKKLEDLNVPFELTRRGAIRSTMKGKVKAPDRAVVVHLDTLGSMVSGMKDNGRLEVVMIGNWSARFAEGAKVTIFAEDKVYGGTILPLKASGHVYDNEIDNQPVSWDNLEVRVDEIVHSKADLELLGIEVGNFIAIHPEPSVSKSGFINSRHLDNKAGVACLLTSMKYIIDNKFEIPVNCYPLFTIAEEEGTGASSVLHGDVASMIAVDNSTIAPGKNSSEYGVTIAARDRGGVYDFHLTKKLKSLCEENDIEYSVDTFKYYRSDAASAIEAGNDLRTALICFGLDSSHGYERTHFDSLMSLSKLIVHYMRCEPEIKHDKQLLSPLKNFVDQMEE